MSTFVGENPLETAIAIGEGATHLIRIRPWLSQQRPMDAVLAASPSPCPYLGPSGRYILSHFPSLNAIFLLLVAERFHRS
jgi:hypothetical protein